MLTGAIQILVVMTFQTKIEYFKAYLLPQAWFWFKIIVFSSFEVYYDITLSFLIKKVSLKTKQWPIMNKLNISNVKSNTVI